ncbi:MAG: hypothetical protein AMK70_00860 [Nitrospira bacterium SG8_35_1]|nr:MAG: hypothetical protein AMK70_00860 [Nitrospira bacterium SG8_35_1]
MSGENIIEELNTQHWDWKLWLRAILCALIIFLTVPIARSIQQIVYQIYGKEFFTHAVLLVFLSALCLLMYLFFFTLRIRSLSQYAWLILSAGIYVYWTIRLGRSHPEEAVHLLEYALLAYFVFRALSHRIRDWTVYITAALFVTLVGIADEFVQWLLPGRVWDYKDVGINMFAGGLFLLAVSQGVRPQTICRPVNTFSVKMLVGSIAGLLIVLALCLSNTPDNVIRYTSIFESLSWLRKEESMTNSITSSFSTKAVWSALFVALIILRAFGKKWEKRLNVSRRTNP